MAAALLPACRVMAYPSAEHVYGTFEDAENKAGHCTHINDGSEESNPCKEEYTKYVTWTCVATCKNTIACIPLCGQIIACDRFIENTCYLCCEKSCCNRPLKQRSFYQENCKRGAFEFLFCGIGPFCYDCYVNSKRQGSDYSRGLWAFNPNNEMQRA